ncbi:MAG: hypothetical protein QM647_13135 [Asticcacaulis sp.]|uniref:hypothetical protein n=1 Tax=Asticcacaulis sp. TaxID=1872648 RepID=UPI0039E3240C
MSDRDMTVSELIEGLKWLDNPDQGMRYFSGGIDDRGPKYDSETGERIWRGHKPAELTVGGQRAKFLHRLIRSAPNLAKLLEADQ